MLVFLDIETLCTEDPEVIQFLADKIKAPATYKKPESIAEWERENKPQAVKEAVAKTALDGLYGRICCIGYAIDDGPVECIAGDDEKSVLFNFFSDLEAKSEYMIVNPSSVMDAISGTLSMEFVGHNIAGFDLPFIKHRSIVHGIKPTEQIRLAMNSGKWSNRIHDTMLMWAPDRDKWKGLDALCKALRIPGKGDMDGSMVAEVWKDNPQKVIDYCKSDVERTRALYKRMMFM